MTTEISTLPTTTQMVPNGPKWSQMDVVGSIPRRDLVTEISDILPKKHNTVRFAKNILYDSIFLSFPQNRSSRYSDSSQVIIKYDHNDNLLAFAKAKKLPRIFENRGRKNALQNRVYRDIHPDL